MKVVYNVIKDNNSVIQYNNRITIIQEVTL